MPITNTPSTGCSTPVPYNLQFSLPTAFSMRCLWSGKKNKLGKKKDILKKAIERINPQDEPSRLERRVALRTALFWVVTRRVVVILLPTFRDELSFPYSGFKIPEKIIRNTSKHCAGKKQSSLTFLQPTGHVMHQQFNIQQLYALPTLYLCVLYLSENKQRLVPLTM